MSLTAIFLALGLISADPTTPPAPTTPSGPVDVGAQPQGGGVSTTPPGGGTVNEF